MTSDSVVRAVGVVAHALEHVAVGDAGGGEEDVVAGDEAVRVEDLVEVVAGVDRGLRSSSSRGHRRPSISPPTHLIAAAEITPSGVPPIPQSRSTPVPRLTASSAPATSPSVMKRIARAGLADLVDRVLVARAGRA